MDEILRVLNALCAVRAGRALENESMLLKRLDFLLTPLNHQEWEIVKQQMWRQWPIEVARRTLSP